MNKENEEEFSFQEFTEEEINTVIQNIQSIPGEALVDLSTALQGWTDPLGQIASWIYDRLKEIASWIASAVDSVVRTFYNAIVVPALNAISAAVGGIQVIVSSISKGIGDIWNFIQGIPRAVQSFIDSLWKSIASALDSLGSSISRFFSDISRAVSDLGSRVLETFRGVWDWIRSGIEYLASRLNEIGGRIWEGIQAISSRVLDALRGVSDWIKSGIDLIVGRLSDFGRWIWEGVQSLGARILEGISSFWSWMRSSIDWIYTRLTDIGRWIGDALQGLGSRILESFRGFWDWIKSGIDWIYRGLEGIGAWIRSAFNTLYDHLSRVGSILNEFAKYVTQFGAMVLGGIQSIGNFIANIPGMLANAFKPVVDFFVGAGKVIGEFFTNPGEAFRKYIVDPLWSGLQWIGSKILEGFGWIWQQLQNFAKTVMDWIKGFIEGLQRAISGFISWISDAFRSLAEAISQGLRKVGEWIIGLVRVPAQAVTTIFSGFSDNVKNIISELGISSPPYLTADKIIGGIAVGTGSSILLYVLMYPIMIGARALTFALKGISFHISHLLERIKISLKPLGLGGEASFNLGKALGSTLYSIAEEIDRVSGKWLEYSSLGLLFSYGQALSRFVTYHLRNYIPIEIPPIGAILESVRRGSVADSYPEVIGKSFSDLYDGMRYYLALRGFADYFVSIALADAKEFYVEIKDRFETKRKIPLALRYQLPSPSEVVRWLIRDIVNPPVITTREFEKNIEKLLGMRGYPPEIAKLYYIAHFRYPPPSALADFFWRAVAKTLWLPDSMEEPEIAQAVGAKYKAVSPRDLNRDFKTVREAIERYWRWHDYAPFTWYPNFTTDKAIMVELTADLPRRIDLRWLMRWGIFEHLGALIRARGMSVLSPIPDIVSMIPDATGKELLSSKVTPEISLDVRLLARLLEATGYHPDFVPILSVALAHQILTEEMTLTRTGFLASYREGVLSLDSAEKLMSGLFIIKFYTGYIDTEKDQWIDITYNKPLLWLPGERRLLQLRAVFDRHVDLWRDFMREVVSGVRRIAITSKDALEYMKTFFSDLSKQWSESVKAISGVDWSPELDEKYISLWLRYADLTRIIESRIWVRHYIARISGWLMYRVSYGWLSKEDYESLIKSMVSKEWLTEYEAEFFLTIFEWIAGIVRKEYIPTPSTLATLSEYMVIDKSVVTMVFEKLRIPEDIRSLYEEYIRVRPIKSDFKSLLSAYRRAYTRGYISEEVWKSVLSEAREYGFRDIEISLLERLADIEMLMRGAEEYIPTLAQLIQFAEYTNIAKEDIERVLSARKVDKPWRDLWMKLISARVIADDVRALLTSYYRALRSGVVIPSEVEKKCKDYFSLAGLTQEELAIRDLAITLDQMIENLPSLGALATMFEYIDVPLDYIQEIIRRRRIEPRYAELWIKYLQTRAISSEVNRAVSAFERLYERYFVPEELIKRVKSLMAFGGWTSGELSIFDFVLDLRKSYRILTILIPSLRAFLSDASYIPNWNTLLEDLFRTYGITIDQYRSQLEYYKSLIKNRRLWRHFSWWRSQLAYAYQRGAISLDEAKRRLEKWKARGLVDDDEISAILEGLELRRAAYFTR